MADLVKDFGNREDGELIRKDDWNGFVEAVEKCFDQLDSKLDSEIDKVNARIGKTEAEVDKLQADVAPLEGLAGVLQERFRRLDLSTTRNAFAIGERAEIVARVTDLMGEPLKNLSRTADRPWVDFICVWGSLKAAPGFTAKAGTGGKSVTVQVNAQGEAKVFLREETGEALAEEQEQEVEAVLDTAVSGRRIADRFLQARTPGDSALKASYTAITAAYEHKSSKVMRNYLDTHYLRNPSRGYSPITPTIAFKWREECATVMAFVKPDDRPLTADGAMAATSIRVTFRDWIYPWIITHYLPAPKPKVDFYRGGFVPLVVKGYEPAVTGIFDLVDKNTKDAGILGNQREITAAQQALATLQVNNAPKFLPQVLNAVTSGLTVQQSLIYSQAVTPATAEDTKPGRAVGTGLARGEAAADKVATSVSSKTTADFARAEARILDNVRAENTKLQNRLLSDDGPVRAAEFAAQSATREVAKFALQLEQKAPIQLVGQLLNTNRR
ncbi:MAG: hypothetical protein AAGJ28_02480 [Pseudomonadota bacterium]